MHSKKPLRIDFAPDSKKIIYDFNFSINWNLKVFSINLNNMNLEPLIENFIFLASLKLKNDKTQLQIMIEHPFLINISYALFKSLFYLVTFIKSKNADSEENTDIIFKTGKKKKENEISYFIKNSTGKDLRIWTYDQQRATIIKHNDLTALEEE